MTISEINTYVTHRTGQDTTTYTAALRLISTNRWMHKITDMIYNALGSAEHDDYNQTTESIVPKNTTANQGYVDLGVSDKILNFSRVEVSYDSTNYYEATPISEGEIGTSISTQSLINQNFQTTKPYYRLKGKFLYLYPVPTASVTGGLKLWVDREASEFTSGEVTTGTKEPGFDEEWHFMVALGMCYDWFVAKKLWQEVSAVANELVDYEARLKRTLGGKTTDSNYRLSAGVINYN